MDKLILAERTRFGLPSELFMLPELRLRQEMDKCSAKEREYARLLRSSPNPHLVKSHIEHVDIWSSYGKAPNIDPEHFNVDRSYTRHELSSYAFLPIIAIGNVLDEADLSNVVIGEVARILGAQNKPETLFTDAYLRACMDKVLGYKVVSGNLHLPLFTPTERNDRYKKEAVLYFTSASQTPSINKEGLICSPDGKPISREIYGSVEIPARGLHYNQDERRDVALKGELDLSLVGKLTAHRNAFHQFSWDSRLSWSKLGLVRAEEPKR